MCVCVSMHSHMYTCLCAASHQHLPFSERRFEEYRSSSMVVVVVESSRSERHGQPQTAQSTEALGACSDGSRPGCPTSVVVPGSSEVQMRCDQLPYFRVSSYVTTNSCAACKQGSIPFGTVDFPSGTRIGAWKETNRWTDYSMIWLAQTVCASYLSCFGFSSSQATSKHERLESAAKLGSVRKTSNYPYLGRNDDGELVHLQQAKIIPWCDSCGSLPQTHGEAQQKSTCVPA